MHGNNGYTRIRQRRHANSAVDRLNKTDSSTTGPSAGDFNDLIQLVSDRLELVLSTTAHTPVGLGERRYVQNRDRAAQRLMAELTYRISNPLEISSVGLGYKPDTPDHLNRPYPETWAQLQDRLCSAKIVVPSHRQRYINDTYRLPHPEYADANQVYWDGTECLKKTVKEFVAARSRGQDVSAAR